LELLREAGGEDYSPTLTSVLCLSFIIAAAILTANTAIFILYAFVAAIITFTADITHGTAVAATVVAIYVVAGIGITASVALATIAGPYSQAVFSVAGIDGTASAVYSTVKEYVGDIEAKANLCAVIIATC
jgi:hypothetical protein